MSRLLHSTCWSISGRIRGMKAYLDNMATTPIDPRVGDYMSSLAARAIGNPHAALHAQGREAGAVLAEARAAVAASIGARPEEIRFAPSATIADNVAILGLARARTRRGRHILVSSIEHPAVLLAARHLAVEEGFEVEEIPVGRDGIVDPASVMSLLRPDTTLVSVMALNNEIGTVQPISEIAKVLEGSKAFFHTDASQAPGRIATDFAHAVDLMTLSSHKVYGPKGAAALFIRRRRDINIKPVFFGGGQEDALFPGTVNVLAAAGFGLAMELAVSSREADWSRIDGMSRRLVDGIVDLLPGSRPVGDRGRAVPHCVSITVSGVSGEAFVSRLARAGVAVSIGSACHGDPASPSHVLVATGLSPAEARGTVRFGMGRFTTMEEIDYTLKQVRTVAAELARPVSI